MERILALEQYIERLLDGNFEYDRGKLEFSEQRVELTLNSGDRAEGSFIIYGAENKSVEGRVSSTEVRMEVLTNNFSGSKDEISYRFRSEGLEAGDVIKGDFRIISNRGEYMLPFVVTINPVNAESSMGDIRNIFHFANLARTDWREAVELFYSKDFDLILKDNAAAYMSAYRGLIGSADRDLALEEFLRAINKKQAVEYVFEKNEVSMEAPYSVTEDTINIHRNGWGYTRLNIESDADFIRPEKRKITDVDFMGNTCRIRYRIDPKKLHSGVNIGAIIFSNVYTSFKVVITVRVPVNDDRRDLYMRKKRLTYDLMKLFMAFRLRKLSSNKWLLQAAELTTRMRSLDQNDPIFAMYQAHYLITASRTEEGEALLDSWQNVLMDSETPEALRSYFLYLKTLLSRDEDNIMFVARRIQEAFYEDPYDWRIAWLLQFVSIDFASDSGHKWELFKDLYIKGCRSPIIYIEALLITISNPSMLMRLDSFEQAVIMTAVKMKALPLQLTDRIVYLSRHIKQYNKVLLDAMKLCFEIKSDEDTLTQICAMLINGNRTDSEAFIWYEKAINTGIRLTRLYEYYMAAMPMDKSGTAGADIPKSVIMYFSHGIDLDYEASALLYRYIYDHRDSLYEFYPLYEDRIREFAAAQLAKGRINEPLSFLYKKFMTQEMVNTENAKRIFEALYTSRIRISNPSITGVAVVYDKLLNERVYPVCSGVALLPIYGNDYRIILLDNENNRFAEGISYNTDKLIIPGRLTSFVKTYINSLPEYLDLFLCELSGGSYSITMENVAAYRQLSVSQELQIDCRSDIRQNLIRFYNEHDFTRQLTECLKEEDPSELSVVQRNEILELMVLLGLHERALLWLKRFGTHKVDPKIIMRLCARMTDPLIYKTDYFVQEIIFDAFCKGRYDNLVVEFLMAVFNGSCREMRDIWSAAKSLGMNTARITQRIIRQMLYSGAYIGERMDIFKDYVKHGADERIEAAFVAQSAYDHFVKDAVTSEFVYRRIGRMMISKTELPIVCGMDYLKYFAGNRTGEFDKNIAEKILNRLMDNDIYFPFFSEYTDIIPETERYAERVMFQYRADPGKAVVIHYALSREADEETVYTTKRMREMYDSVYVISFMLFFGEELQYYITEQSDSAADKESDVQLTESGTLSRSDIRQPSEEKGRFAFINDLCIAEVLQDYDAFDRLIQEYYHTKYLTEHLFSISRKEEDNAAWQS